MAYQKPGIEVSQEYATQAVPTIPSQYACIIGPSYVEYNYTDNRSDIDVGEYNHTIDNDYTVYNPSSKTIVPSEITVTAADLLLRYYSHTPGTTFYVKGATEPNKIEAAGGFYFASYTNSKGATYNRDANLYLRDVKVGDYAYAHLAGVDRFLVKIIALENQALAASTGAAAYGTNNLSAATADGDIAPNDIVPPAVDLETTGAGLGTDTDVIVGSYIGDMTTNPPVSLDDYTVWWTSPAGTALDITHTWDYASTYVTDPIYDDTVPGAGVVFDLTYGYTNPSTTNQYYSIRIVDVVVADIFYEIWKCGPSTSDYKDGVGQLLASGACGVTDELDVEYGLGFKIDIAIPAPPSNWIGKWQKIEILASPARLKCTSTHGDNDDNIVFPGRYDIAALPPPPFMVSYNIPIGQNGLEIQIGDILEVGDECPADTTNFTAYDPTDPVNSWSFTVGAVTDCEMQYDAIVGTSAGTFTGIEDTTFTLTCIKGGYFDNAVAGNQGEPIYLKVRNASGTFTQTITGISHTVATSIGYGVTLAFTNNTQEGIATNDVFYVDCSAAALGGYNVIQVDTDLTTLGFVAPLYLDLFIQKDSVEIGSRRAENEALEAWAYTPSTNKLTLEDNLKLKDSTWTNLAGEMQPIPLITEMTGVTSYRPDVYIGSRYLDNYYANQVITISSEDEATSYYGADSTTNKIRHGLSKALTMSTGVPVKAISIISDDETGYANALKELEKTEDIYHLVPMTSDLDIFELFETHINTMSSSTNKKFRKIYFSRELITYEYLFGQYYDAASQMLKDYTATITADPLNPTEYTLVTAHANGDPDFTLAVVEDCIFEYAFETIDGVLTWTEYNVEEALTKTTLLLKTGPAAPVGAYGKFRIKKTYTASGTATQMKTWAEATDNKRITNIVLSALTESGSQVASYFMAASVAGLRTAYPSHKPLTNMAISGYDRVYTRDYFSEANLDTIAEGGNLIVTQDTTNGNIYIRHQLTTKMDTLDEREDSLVCVLDLYTTSLWKAQKDFIGKFNVSPDLIDRLRYLIDSVGDTFMHTKFGILGPYIKSYEITKLEQNSTYSDQVDEEISVDLPEPFNHLKIYIRVI